MTAPRFLSCGCIRWNADITHFCWRHVQQRRRLRAAGIRPATDPYMPLPKWERVKPRPRWKAFLLRLVLDVRRWWVFRRLRQIRKAGF